jgi:2-haloacid dehalogenase
VIDIIPNAGNGLIAKRFHPDQARELTNSPQQLLDDQMSNSELGEDFEQLVSVDQIGRFKPAPETCPMAAGRLGVDIQQVRLVAAHDWDVFGALRAGCLAAYIARAGRPYHPLYEQPNVMGVDLTQVTEQILQIRV